MGVLHQLGDLRDDEDENQIEEEFDRGNAHGFLVYGCGHGQRRFGGVRCACSMVTYIRVEDTIDRLPATHRSLANTRRARLS
jgi:hypothetical protein